MFIFDSFPVEGPPPWERLEYLEFLRGKADNDRRSGRRDAVVGEIRRIGMRRASAVLMPELLDLLRTLKRTCDDATEPTCLAVMNVFPPGLATDLADRVREFWTGPDPDNRRYDLLLHTRPLGDLEKETAFFLLFTFHPERPEAGSAVDSGAYSLDVTQAVALLRMRLGDAIMRKARATALRGSQPPGVDASVDVPILIADAVCELLERELAEDAALGFYQRSELHLAREPLPGPPPMIRIKVLWWAQVAEE